MTTLRALLVSFFVLGTPVVFGKDDTPDPWSKAFTPPAKLDTGRVHLEPLGPQHAELDHHAFMSSREHLRKSLHWGNWPADDTTVADNRKDLERHSKEFEKREAYAYTVLAPDHKRCLGCVYLEPVENKPRTASFAYWVIADALPDDLDQDLVKAVLDWIERDWPLDEVRLPLHADNARGFMIAEKLGLHHGDPGADDRVQFVWQRGKNGND